MFVSNLAASVASGTLLLSILFYIWPPRKHVLWASFIVFLGVISTASILIVDTGGYRSPYIALWMLIAVFAALFGAYGIVPLFIAGNAYVASLYIHNVHFSQSTIIVTALAVNIPLIVSYIIWHRKAGHDNGSDSAYRELANELSQVANKSEVVINAIADGVIAIDNQGIIQLINPAAQQLLGWGKQDALSLNYKSVLKMTDAKDAEVQLAGDPIQQVLTNNREVRSDDLSLTTSSGKKFLASIDVSPVGQVGSGAIVVFRDITREKAEEREQAEFISTASHEMRTPVATIEGYLGLALNPNTAQIDAKARDFITKAHESAQHLGRLFQDLLDVSKADDGRLSNNPKVMDVVSFTHDIVQGLTPKAKEKGLRIFYKPNPDDDTALSNERHLTPVFYVFLDNDHIREIIANLVENAIKYTPQGDVVIDVDGDTDHVTVSVQDSGIGIPAEDMPHLFQKFYRVDNRDTREIGGTGLGLYLSRRLAETLGGRLWVESEYKKGSTFYLELPRISHEEAMQKLDEATEQAAAAAEQAPSQPIVPPIPTPVQPPVYQPTPQPVAAQPVQPVPPMGVGQTPLAQTYQRPAPPQQPVYQQAPIPQAPPMPPQNTPLSAIEQNPSQFIQPRVMVGKPNAPDQTQFKQ